jgi:hypothetical protein
MDKLPLSVLAFLLGAGAQAQTARPINLKSLEILNEVKMTPDEYRQLMQDHAGVFDSNLTSGNYDTFNSDVTDGNYDTFNSDITDGNYDTFNSDITDGNYDTFNSDLTDGNYGSDVDPNLKAKLEALPTPSLKTDGK